METTDGLSLLHLLQLADSAFPIGGFAHSAGLETLIQEVMPRNENSPEQIEAVLLSLMRARLAIELTRTDLPLLWHAHALGPTGSVRGIVELDALAMAVRPVWEWREAGARMGKRMIDAVCLFGSTPLLEDIAQACARGPQLPVAFGLAAQQLGCAALPAAQAYAASFCTSQTGAAVRLGLLGQRAMQRILHQLKPEIVSAAANAAHITLDAIGGAVPLLEIAGMRHRYASERLFTS